MMRIPRRMVPVAALLLAAAPAAAQTRADTAGAPQTRILPALGLRAGAPQKLSVAVGVVGGIAFPDQKRFHDVALYVEPGIGAGRATAAYVTGFGDLGRGLGIGATVLRTWSDPWSLQPNASYVGVETWLWPLFYVGPRVGLFRAMSGDRPRGWHMTLDFGIGL
jgi:hypothetical protein